MISKPKNHSHVFVVDARVADYGELIEAFGADGVGVELFASGRAALRHDPHDPPDLWVINMHLPDLDGPDLLSMLRNRYPGVPLYLVSDDYNVEEEISARCSGAEMYFCKPLQESWLAASVMARR
jgi:DNA-binding response OmpR family regulator